MDLKGCVNRDKISEDVDVRKGSFSEAEMFLVCYEYLRKTILNNFILKLEKQLENFVPIFRVAFNHPRRQQRVG